MDFQGQPEVYDLLILGSGAGSKLLAWTFAGQGQRVTVVERKYVGRACPNIAYLPSKNIIHTAQVAHNVRRSEEFGISVDSFRVNMPAVRDRKRRMVQGLVDTHLALYRQSGAELIMASGKFIGPKILEATLENGTKRLLTGKKVVIGTGTHAAIENIPGLASAQPLTHVEALELDVVPEHLIILGEDTSDWSLHRRCVDLAVRSQSSSAAIASFITKTTTSPRACRTSFRAKA